MIIFERVQSMHQAQSPPNKNVQMAQSKLLEANQWQDTFSLISTITLHLFMHLMACQPSNERRKKGTVGVFNTSFAQNKLQRQSPNSVLSYWGGWVLVSYLYFIQTVALTNTIQCF